MEYYHHRLVEKLNSIESVDSQYHSKRRAVCYGKKREERQDYLHLPLCLLKEQNKKPYLGSAS